MRLTTIAKIVVSTLVAEQVVTKVNNKVKKEVCTFIVGGGGSITGYFYLKCSDWLDFDTYAEIREAKMNADAKRAMHEVQFTPKH